MLFGFCWGLPTVSIPREFMIRLRNAWSSHPPSKLSTMYLVQVDNLINNFGLGVSRLQISAITGPVGSEVLDLNAAFTPTTNAWLSADPFFLFTGSGPQLSNSFGIDMGDSRIQTVL